MRTFSRFFIFCTVFIILSCASLSPVKVSYEYFFKADFAALKSYDWFPLPRQNVRHGGTIENIRRALSRQLEAGGFKKVSRNPDFLIALHGGIQSRLDFEEWEYIHKNYEQYAKKRRVDVMKYDNEMVMFDFIDTKSNTLIYRATATAVISIEPSAGELDRKINEAVLKVVKNFYRNN